MRWANTETPTFAGSHGTGATGPDVAETLQLVDRTGNVIATFTKDVTGAYSFSVSGALSATGATDVTGALSQATVPVLTNQTGVRAAHAKYSFAVDGGATGTLTPATSDTIPANAIIVGGTVNSTTAVTSNGSATVAVGTAAGSSTTALLGATAKASLSLNAILNAVPVLATPVKLTAAGAITITIGAAALTAGIIEIWVYYVVAAA